MQQFKRLVWGPEYTVHVEELDVQHRNLFRITNNVLALYEDGSGELYPLLKDLVEYLCTHIRSENAVMIKCNYPDYAEQDSQHADFIDKMQSFLKSYKEDDKDLTFQMLSYLHGWIYSHTTTMDLKYGQYLVRTRAEGKK
ncbi:MAG: bacteriohemerythrin [Syntrophales bacterium]